MYTENVARHDGSSDIFYIMRKGLLMGIIFTIFSFFYGNTVAAFDAVNFNQYYDTGNTYPTINSCTGIKIKLTDNFAVNQVTFWKNNTGTATFQLFVATSTGTTAFTNAYATSSLIVISDITSNIPIVFPMNFTIASGTTNYFCVKASSVSGTVRMPGSTTFYNDSWIRGHATNVDQNAVPMVRISGTFPYTCPECEECSSCPDYGFPEYPTEINQSPDISVIAQKSYIYDNSSSSPIGVNYSYFYIPWLQWMYIFMITASIIALTLFFKYITSKYGKKK